MGISRRINALTVSALLFFITLGFAALNGKAFGVSVKRGATYKVGVNAHYGISKTDKGYEGIACDYLNELTRYSGDSFTYVSGSAKELFEMLLDGRIDMIPCIHENERSYFESLINGSDRGLTKTAGSSLLMRFSAVYVYDKGEYKNTALNDADTVSKMKLGYLEEDAQNYFHNGEFVYPELADAQFVGYTNEETIRDDLYSGKIDGAVKCCLRSWADETIVYQFPVRSGYFVIRSEDSELEKMLSTNLTTLFSDNPSFYGEVYEQYISNYGMQKFAYSKEEREYLDGKEEIALGFNLKSDSMQCYDTKSTRLSGVIGALADRYSDITGLSIKVKAYSTLTDCLNALSENEVDIVFGGLNSSDANALYNYYISSPALNTPLALCGKSDTELNEFMKIAVCRDDTEARSAIARFYPRAAVTLTDTAEDAYNSAMSGGAACLGSYDSIFLKNKKNSSLSIIETFPLYSTQCFALRSDDNALIGVTECALRQINSSALISDVYNLVELGEFVPHTNGVSALQGILISVGGTAIIVLIFTFILLESRRKAEVDPLTGGHTRASFIAAASKALKKYGADNCALMVFDINKFKFINDRLGYAEGNRMLDRMHKTLCDKLERGELCARISDDIFACFIKNGSDTEIRTRVRGVLEEFERRNSIFVSEPVVFSAGICRLEQCRDKDGQINLNTAIDRCNIAKNSVKGRHESAAAFYDGKIREKALRERNFESLMPTALEKRSFLCYLQPKYGTKSRRIEGAEALIRWKDPELGFIFPDEFIPIAEKNGFVVELDFFILEQVCKAMRHWLDKGLTPVVISVNQSRRHLSHDDYIWRLREIVDKYAIPYEYIELEITETVFTDNADLLLQIMHKLHEIGFKLAIDDFGSGYSSLNMLKDIPADVVKIDREFFNGTVDTDKGKAVISAVVALASKLNMSVTAEGVETLTQVEFLDDINCELIQGYYFSKPVPLEEFEAMWYDELKKFDELK